jgi:hypothetical protein
LPGVALSGAAPTGVAARPSPTGAPALVAVGPRPALTTGPAPAIPAAIAVRAALPAITLLEGAPVVASAPLAVALPGAATAVPAGSQPRRALSAAPVVALPASCRAAYGTALSIIGSAAAIAIFSRAVIAGTIRDTHL